MEERSNESTPKRPDGERPVDASLVIVPMPAYIDQIKKESSWRENDRNAITVFKSDQLRLLLIALHAGAEMPRHTAPGSITIQVLEGRMEVVAGERTVELSQGEVLVLHERIPHAVKARSESVFLLTIAVS